MVDSGGALRFVTWSNSKSDPRLALLLDSAALFGIKVEVMPCADIIEKPYCLEKFIDKWNEETVVVATDAFDVLYTSTAQKIYDAYISFQRPIVFGGEKICSHHFPESRHFFDSQTNCGSYRYLNSGLIIGNVFELKRMLKTIRAWEIAALKRHLKIRHTKGDHKPDFQSMEEMSALFGKTAAQALHAMMGGHCPDRATKTGH